MSSQAAQGCQAAYEEQLNSTDEPLIEISDVQGDVILGFNKERNWDIVLDITADPQQVKQWLLNIVIPHVSTCRDVLSHRNKFRHNYGSYTGPAFFNISFSYNALTKLLTGTAYESTLFQFDSSSPFVKGAACCAPSLGDNPKDWKFGSEKNNDILISIASDDEGAIEGTANLLLYNIPFLTVRHMTKAFRGSKAEGDMYYGHENFGFQDGLSQPEVRGTYTVTESTEEEFIVRRKILPTDPRFKDYSAPGFDLLDTGLFIIGYGRSDKHKPPQIPIHPKYPKWCRNASFSIYRELHQDVYGFWKMNHCTACDLNNIYGLNLGEEEVKNLAGALGAKCIGRWWDGTPFSLGKPITGIYYPPPVIDEKAKSKVLASKATGLENLKNGFLFNKEQDAWPVFNGKCFNYIPPSRKPYAADFHGLGCPFGSHIRKMNPRDEPQSTNTKEHRILRRANNFGTRVADVFGEPDGEDRGLALIMYVGDIEKQFEFVQRKWANTDSLPIPPGTDMVIGQPKSTVEKHLPCSVTDPTTGKALMADITSHDQKYISTIGMGYFLLPSIWAMKNVLSAPQV